MKCPATEFCFHGIFFSFLVENYLHLFAQIVRSYSFDLYSFVEYRIVLTFLSSTIFDGSFLYPCKVPSRVVFLSSCKRKTLVEKLSVCKYGSASLSTTQRTPPKLCLIVDVRLSPNMAGNLLELAESAAFIQNLSVLLDLYCVKRHLVLTGNNCLTIVNCHPIISSESVSYCTNQNKSGKTRL